MAPSVASEGVAASVERGGRPDAGSQPRRWLAVEAAASVSGRGQQGGGSQSNGHKQRRRQPAAGAAASGSVGGAERRQGGSQRLGPLSAAGRKPALAAKRDRGLAATS